MARVRGVPVDVPACVSRECAVDEGFTKRAFIVGGHQRPVTISLCFSSSTYLLFFFVYAFLQCFGSHVRCLTPSWRSRNQLRARRSSMHRIALRTPALFPKPVVKNTLRIPIYQLDAFASAPFKGNPAAVCPLDA